MAWLKSHTVLIRHRKLIMMAKELRLKPVYLLGHFHALWHAALEQAEDGDLSCFPNDLIAELACYEGDAEKFVSLLQTHKWLDGKILHDWLDYAGPFLRTKYKSSNRERLVAIWAKHGRDYGEIDLGTTKEQLRNNLGTIDKIRQTDEIRQDKTPASPPFKDKFEYVWAKYPNKDGRKLAERAFFSSVKTEKDLKDIMTALENYLRTERVKKGFIKNGSTWFNNWRDWINFVDKPGEVRGGNVKPFED